MDWRNTCGIKQAGPWRDYSTEGVPTQGQPMEVSRLWRLSTTEAVAILAERCAKLVEEGPGASSGGARKWRAIAKHMLGNLQQPPLPPWGLGAAESLRQQQRRGRHLKVAK